MSWNDVVSKIGSVLRTRLFDLAGTPISIATGLTFIVIIVATFYISHLLQRALGRVFQRRGLADVGNLGVGKRLLHYVTVLIGLGVALETVGIDLKALFAAGALFAVAIGFAMQTITQNFVSGVILLAERIIKPGDIIEFDGTVAKVQTMGIRATIVRTLDEEEIIVPNSHLVQNAIKNFTLQDAEFRVRAPVGVVYGADMKKVWQVLETMAAGLEWRVKDRDPVVLLREFGDNSVNFEISVWIDDPWKRQRRKSQLLDSIWWALKENDIVIAFPQLDVHFDPPIQESLNRLGGRPAADA